VLLSSAPLSHTVFQSHPPRNCPEVQPPRATHRNHHGHQAAVMPATQHGRTYAPGRTLPCPRLNRPSELGPVRSVRTRNSMSPIDFSTSQSSEVQPCVRDRFGTERSSGGTPENRLGFFDFQEQMRCETVTHNPLVPGSSPGGPTISL
jgi:hypothetical protein